MEDSIVAILGALFVGPISMVTMIIYLRKYTNEERMKLIEMGGDVSSLRGSNSDSRFSTLRIALLLIGIGCGFLFGSILDATLNLEEVGYFSMLFICGGSGLGIAYLIESKNTKK